MSGMLTERDFEPLLTDRQAAEMLGLDVSTVQHYCRTGRLPARKIGRFWRTRRSWLEAWLRGEQPVDMRSAAHYHEGDGEAQAEEPGGGGPRAPRREGHRREAHPGRAQ